ncbi:MAG: phosphonate C-P lyase system protein PhnH [Pseudomonadota bacterium]
MDGGLSEGFANPPIDAARAFRAVMQAIARPGTQHTVAAPSPGRMGAAMAGVLLCICDHETPIWLAPSIDVPEVRDWVRFHTGAFLAERDAAQFAFGSWAEMLPLDDFAIGTPDYPDRSATLVVEVPELGAAHRLTGPGIKDTAHLTVPDPDAIRSNNALFPLGLDFLLTSIDQVAGLPRTTRVEV